MLLESVVNSLIGSVDENFRHVARILVRGVDSCERDTGPSRRIAIYPNLAVVTIVVPKLLELVLR